MDKGHTLLALKGSRGDTMVPAGHTYFLMAVLCGVL